VAANLAGGQRQFTGADLSTKLKLMGIDVASFGDYEIKPEQATPLVYEDPFQASTGNCCSVTPATGSWRRAGRPTPPIMAAAGLVPGRPDASPFRPASLIVPAGAKASPAAAAHGLPDEAQVCSCNNVNKGQICRAVVDRELTTLAEVKAGSPRPEPAAAAACRSSPTC